MRTMHTILGRLRSVVGTFGGALALVTILSVGSGCESAGGDAESGGLLGKVGASLGSLKKGDGKVSLDGAAESRGRPARDESPSAGDDGSPSAEDDGDGGFGGATGPACHAACEHIVNCMLESCPALGTPDVDDVAAVVSDCAAVCDATLSSDQAASIRSLSCSDVWAEMVATEPELDEACGNEPADDGWDDEAWDDEGWDDEGRDDESEDCEEYEYEYEAEYEMGADDDGWDDEYEYEYEEEDCDEDGWF